MEWTKKSIYSGVVRTKDLPITLQQICQYEDGVDINECMPHLTQEEKMFFVSGITEEDWDESTVSIGDKRDL